VYAADLETGTQIIGLLGLPLGELASVTARIVVSSSKSVDRYVEVSEINGRRLSKPIEMEFTIWQWGGLSNKELPLGQRLRLRVYETGGMVGVPRAAMEETVTVATVAWKFQTSLVVLYQQD